MEIAYAFPIPIKKHDDRKNLLRLRTHNQNMTVAARQMAEKKTVGHLS